MQDVFRISPCTGHYSFHFENTYGKFNQINAGQVIYKYLVIFD